jgi:F0F1-type ATP synthase assembly protein I
MPANPRKDGGPQASDLAGVGLAFAASVALFLFLGMWADGKLGTSPWLLILGAFIGGAGGFWSMYRKLVVAPRQKDRETTDRK